MSFCRIFSLFHLSPPPLSSTQPQYLPIATPQVVPGRVSLLVTLFLSLTGILVSTISSSPEVNPAGPSPSMQCRKCKKFFFPLQVSQGLTALTFWVLVHFLFIFGAIIVYGVQLTLIRSTISIISIFSSHRCQLVPTESDQVCEGRVQPA